MSESLYGITRNLKSCLPVDDGTIFTIGHATQPGWFDRGPKPETLSPAHILGFSMPNSAEFPSSVCAARCDLNFGVNCSVGMDHAW